MRYYTLILKAVSILLLVIGCRGKATSDQSDHQVGNSSSKILLASKGSAFVKLEGSQGWLKIVINKKDAYNGDVIVYFSRDAVFDNTKKPHMEYKSVSMDPFSMRLQEFGITFLFTGGSDKASYLEAVMNDRIQIYYSDKRDAAGPPR